jgi:hypothetical protein
MSPVNTLETGPESGRLLSLAAFALTVCVFAPFASRGFDVHHDSLMLKTALDVLSGQTLFRDTFTQYGALTTYLHVLALKALGPQLLALKYLTVAAYGVAAAFLVASWREFLPSRLVILAFFFWLLFAPFYSSKFPMLPWASVLALAFQSMTIYCLVRALLRPGKGYGAVAWPLLAGVCAALTFWCRTPVGALLCAALAVGCAVQPTHRLRTALLGLAGFALVGALFIGVIASTGAWSDWVQQTIIWPRRWASEMGGSPQAVIRCLFTAAVDAETAEWEGYFRWLTVLGFGFTLRYLVRSQAAPSLKRVLVPMTLALGVLIAANWQTVASIRPWAFLLPVITIGVLVKSFRRVRKTRKTGASRQGIDAPWVWAMGAICLASWLQFYPITCPRHIFWALGPFFGYFIYLAYEGCNRDSEKVLAGFAILLAPLLVSRIGILTENLSTPRLSLDSVPHLRGISAVPSVAQAVQGLSEEIQKYEAAHLARPVVIDGPDALPAILVSDLRTFHPFYIEWTQYSRTPEELELRKAFVRTQKPWIVLQPPRMGDLDYWHREFGYEVVRELGAEAGTLLRPAGG